jgi:hypothetical protein
MADMAVTCKYHEQMLYERAEVIKDFVAVTPGLTSGRGRADVIAVAKQAIGEEGFVKEGATWVGWLGFVFDGNELAQVRPSWSHGGKEPAL